MKKTKIEFIKDHWHVLYVAIVNSLQQPKSSESLYVLSLLCCADFLEKHIAKFSIIKDRKINIKPNECYAIAIVLAAYNFDDNFLNVMQLEIIDRLMKAYLSTCPANMAKSCVLLQSDY